MLEVEKTLRLVKAGTGEEGEVIGQNRLIVVLTKGLIVVLTKIRIHFCHMTILLDLWTPSGILQGILICGPEPGEAGKAPDPWAGKTGMAVAMT